MVKEKRNQKNVHSVLNALLFCPGCISNHRLATLLIIVSSPNASSLKSQNRVQHDQGIGSADSWREGPGHMFKIETHELSLHEIL